jgi:type VI protein secretion system component VasF
MRDEIANVVYPIFAYGLKLKDAVADGTAPDFATARKELLGMLQTAGQAQRINELGPEIGGSILTSTRAETAFLGIRYPLVCWLDEIFITDSAWKTEWTEHILEQTLFKSRDRAWKFWEQAKKAESQQTTDALEVFLLAVLLGFRGDLDDQPDKLRAWCETTRAQIDQTQAHEWKGPVEGQPRTFVPPLTGAQHLQRMLIIAGVAMLLLIPAGMFLLIHSLK